MRISFLIALLIALPLGEGSASFAAAADPCRDLGSDDYAVYSTVIEGVHRSHAMWIGGRERSKSVVVRRWTPGGAESLAIVKEMLAVSGLIAELDDPSLVESFLAVYPKTCLLDERLELEVPYSLLNEGDYGALDAPDDAGWRALRERYPGTVGLVALSRIGFNADRTRALVEVSNQCGNLCGTDYYVVLRKLDGRWQIEKFYQGMSS